MIITFFLVMGIGLLLLFYMWYEAHQIVVKNHELSLENFPESFNGLKVFFISDIHTRVIDDKLLDQLKEPIDIVVIGGDLMEKGVPFERVSKNLDQLSKIAPNYFVWGNNDYEVDFRNLDVLLREKGVTLLDNTCARFESGDDTLTLIGVDDPTVERDDLDLAVSDADDSNTSFKILISHNPSVIEKVNNEHRIGFVLSGHTHGGQIRLFKWGIAERGGFKEYPHTKLFISNGFGYTKLPLRLCAPAESHVFTFYRKTL
ncbi:metallophosphoesterase [Pseudalkalibacillus sp. R45]|uniref:metallophosphoesterase n=1 Tax=Pseudalkalibacillus sp. R45 TaxID=3457433 RepID=UPI003FCDF793